MPLDVFDIDLDDIHPELIRRRDSRLEQENRQRIAQWMPNVPEIQRRCLTQRLRAEDFLALKNSPEPRERAIAETFEYVYERPHTHGSPADCVAVDWNPATRSYEVSNGSNRLLVAKELNLKHYPVIVQAPDIATLRRLRSDSRQRFGPEIPARGLRQIEREHERERLEEREHRMEQQKQLDREQRRKREQDRKR